MQSDSLLKSFSFDIYNAGDHAGGSLGPIPYTANVYEWNSTTRTLVGPALYISPISLVPFTGGYQVVTSSLNVVLEGGLQYVAFLTPSGASTPNAYFAAIFNSTDTMMADVYSGGGFVDINVANPSLLTSASWNQTPGDLWFQADLVTAAVPEPSSVMLLVTGLLAIGVTLKKGLA